MKRMLAAAAFVIAASAAPAFAQPAGWTIEFAAGGAGPTGDLSGRLSAGWDVNTGVGYQFAKWFAVMGEFNMSSMGIPPDVLQASQAPDGYGHIFSVNVEPQVRFPLAGRFSGFVEGGGGWMRRTVALTEPTVQTIDYFDPFYGDIPTQIATDQVLSSTTHNAFGGNFGGGVAVPLASTGADLYVDVRYYYAPTTPRGTTMIPVTFGIRYTGAK